MIRRRVTWDGPNPAPNDYLTEGSGGCRRILAVLPLRTRDAAGARIELCLAETRVAKAPRDATVHPHARMAQSDPAGPQRARQVAGGGPNAVMRSSWRDPDDTRPTAARTAREIAGYRTYCPLRRIASRNGSQITEAHINAADHFRLLTDFALIGPQGERSMMGGGDGYGPRGGPTAAELTAASASREATRFLARITDPMRDMLAYVVLQNNSLQAWCTEMSARRGRKLVPDIEMGRLLVLLDLLVEHYADEVDQFSQTGRLMVPAA